MKIVKQSFEIIDEINGEQILKKIEACGRICHRSECNDAKKFVEMLISRGHESVLEHVSISVRIITDRAIQNEIVRHRLASYSVESTRYVKFSELEIIDHGMYHNIDWHRSEQDYLKLLDDGYAPEIARDVLPLCTKTEMIMTCNLREWRHFFKLRTAKGAHPYMRELAMGILGEFKSRIPVVFDDII